MVEITAEEGSSSFRSSPGPKMLVTPPKDDLLLIGDRHDSASDDECHSGTRRGLDKLMDSHNKQVVVPKSSSDIHMEIPTLADTLSCTHLRRLFFASFLEYRLGDGETKLWNSLCKFHSDFSSLTDMEVSQRQNDIRDSAMKVLSDNPNLPFHDDLVKVITDSVYEISSRFFVDVETKLYGPFYADYESFLAKNQWVRY